MTVEIKITAENAAEAREELARLLGTTALTYEIAGPAFGGMTTGGVMPCAVAEDDAEVPVAEPEPAHVVEDALKATAPVEAPKRERGKPAPGKTRRTKEEIAEDEAADRAEAAAPLTVAAHIALPDDATSEQVAEAFAGLRANISTGEERIDPTSPEDAAQDAADEAAEVEATRGAALTHDDLRDAVGRLQKRIGMAEAVRVTTETLGGALIDVPLDGIEAAIAKLDAYAAPADEPAPTATEQDVIDAMLAYGRVYDGADKKPAEMMALIEDRARIFEATFGPGVTGLSKIDKTPEAFGKAVAAIRAAIEANPFGRVRA